MDKKLHQVARGAVANADKRIRTLCGRKVATSQTRKRLTAPNDTNCLQCVDKAEQGQH